MLYLLILLSTISRILPHPANFTPVGAVAIFATKKYGYKKALFITIAAMLISDIFLGFGWYSIFVYAGFLTYILFQKLFARFKYSPLYSAISGSVAFFAISNLGVWLGPWYEHSLPGLIKCFTLAVPFYRNTILGDLIFTGAIFGLSFILERIKKEGALWHTRSKLTNLTQKS